MKKIFIITFLLILPLILFVKEQRAEGNILQNNIFGVHILFPDELNDAAKLVNSNGGDWGYVTIPIQAGDRDLEKWQKFMDSAKQNHITPIIRLASEGDYFNTKVWRKPTYNDVMDFANFLSSLDWPINNRHVIVFNEPNRGDEWEGVPNPSEYAQILNFAVNSFKARSQNFFMISAGMDNASSNIANSSINEYDFLRQMNWEIPGIFEQIDGLGSHSYPNPGFSQPPTKEGQMGINSFRYEKNLVIELGAKDLPVFITETGWSMENVSESTAANYFGTAFRSVWTNKDVAAVTPFLLRAGTLPFAYFSLLKEDGSKTLMYKAIEDLPKIKGKPLLSQKVLGQKTFSQQLPIKDFSGAVKGGEDKIYVPRNVVLLFKWLMKI